MSRQQRDAVNQMMAGFPWDVGGDAIEQRAVFERITTALPLPDDVTTTSGSLGGVPTLDITTSDSRSDTVLLWFHGGWYVLGSPRTVAALSSDVARRTATRVVSVDYRLAPEHPYPAALQDARAAYRALLDSGVSPHDVAMVGDSAGGGIVVSTLASLADEGLPQPAAAVLFSPWTDLTLSGESMTTKVGIDPAFVPEKVSVRAADYVGDADPADPAISPIFADLRGLPPLLIQAGSYEILLDDSVRLAARAAAADVSVWLEVTPGVPHLFQAFAPMLDEGDAALDNVTHFLETHPGATSLDEA
jgi:monoterpene epsilon-lactone hydrolase